MRFLNAVTHLAHGGKSSTKREAIWYKLAHGSEAKARLGDDVLIVMSEQGFRLDSPGENHCLTWDKGWRIYERSMSEKRTVPPGESRLIKASPSENGLQTRLMKKLGQRVGELGDSIPGPRNAVAPSTFQNAAQTP
jgi:hypothetical protein